MVMEAAEASAVMAATLYWAMPVASTILTRSTMELTGAAGSVMPSTPVGPTTPVVLLRTLERIRLRTFW